MIIEIRDKKKNSPDYSRLLFECVIRIVEAGASGIRHLGISQTLNIDRPPTAETALAVAGLGRRDRLIFKFVLVVEAD